MVVWGRALKNRRSRSASKPEIRRELPEDRTEFLPQREYAGGEEVGQRRFRAAQLEHVRDEPGALIEKTKSAGVSRCQAKKLAGR
jgi:hypothetical protein